MNVLQLYRDTGAYLEGHFLLASGRHSPKFLQSTTFLQYPQHVDAVGAALAGLFKDTEADFVIGPAMGGVVLSYAVARELNTRSLFAEKDGHGGMLIRNAFKVTAGEHFIAVEDVVTTGGSLKKTIAAAEREGGVCVGVGCIIDRGQSQFPHQPSLKSLVQLSFPSYAPADCPLCQDNIPLEDV